MINRKQMIILLIMMCCGTLLIQAKGGFSTLKITDMATDESIQIDLNEADSNLSQFFLFDRCAPQDSEDMNLGDGYEIQRGMTLLGEFEPFDMLIYYPAEHGKRGVIHYIGLVNANGTPDGSSEYDNRWYLTNPLAEPYLREFFLDEPAVQSPFQQALFNRISNRC